MRAGHLAFLQSLSGHPLSGQQMASRTSLCRPMAPREGTGLGNAKKNLPSAYATLASAGERRQKGQRTPSLRACRGQQSSSRPLETKRSQRLSRKSRSHRSKRDRRTSSRLRAAPATAEHHPRALARALPARLVERSGPRQRFFRRQSFLALNPGEARDAVEHNVSFLGRGRLRQLQC